MPRSRFGALALVALLLAGCREGVPAAERHAAAAAGEPELAGAPPAATAALEREAGQPLAGDTFPPGSPPATAADPTQLAVDRSRATAIVQAASRVAPGSPGARAGLRAGDHLVRAGGRRLTTPLDWQSLMLDLRIGETLDVLVENGRRGREVRLVAEELPSLRADRVTVLRDIQLVTLTPQIRQERGLMSDHGALIVEIPPELGERIDLRAGDLIVQINNSPVRSAEDAARLFRRVAGRGPFYLWFERSGAIVSRLLEIPG